MDTARSAWTLALAATLLPLLATAKLPLPPYIKPCSMKLSRADLGKCAVKNGNDAVPKIMNGDRQYRIPSMNPLLVDKMQVDNGQGPLGLNMEISDAKIYGIPGVVINNVDLDFKNRKAHYEAYLPFVNIITKYNISGRVLVLPITGEGDGNLTLKDVHVTYDYDFGLEKQKDGETYFIPKPHNNFQFNTTRLYIQLSNLFNGDKLLGDTTNKFMDENWEEMLVSLGPIFSTAISEIIHNILYNIFKLVPATEAFLDANDLKIP